MVGLWTRGYNDWNLQGSYRLHHVCRINHIPFVVLFIIEFAVFLFCLVKGQA